MHAGETPCALVILECRAETSQHIENPVYTGIMTCELQPAQWGSHTRFGYGVSIPPG